MTGISSNQDLNVKYDGYSGGEVEISTRQEGNLWNRTYYIQGEITLAGIPSADTMLTFSYTWGRTYSAEVKAGALIGGTATIALERN